MVATVWNAARSAPPPRALRPSSIKTGRTKGTSSKALTIVGNGNSKVRRTASGIHGVASQLRSSTSATSAHVSRDAKRARH